jgi:hypothetical protein
LFDIHVEIETRALGFGRREREGDTSIESMGLGAFLHFKGRIISYFVLPNTNK